MIQISRLSHVSLRTPRLDEMTAYYVEVLGLVETGRAGDGSARFGCGDGRTVLELIPAGESALDHVALALPLGLGADAAAEALDLDVRAWEGEVVPGASSALRFEDPDGSVVQLLEPVHPPEPALAGPQPEAPGIGPLKIGHVATRVAELGAVRSLYEEQLGFRYSDSIGDDFLFLRCNADHHSLNFLKSEPAGGLHHIAFELRDWAHTQLACDELAAHGIPLLWGPGRHGPGHNLFTYHRDPDGNIIELFAGIDRMSDEGVGVFDWRPWHDGPQVPRRWDQRDPAAANSWGVMPPPAMEV